MNHTTPYTELESLFLFQSLRNYGFIDGAFNRIAEDLKNNLLIREQEEYDAARLSPELLQQLSLQLLRDEQKHETDAIDVNGAGALSPTSKKRKVPSPPLPSLKEAREHETKLPILVDRLYARYKERIVQAIRKDEQRIETLRREIQSIENGQADEKIVRNEQKRADKNTTPGSTETKPARPKGSISQSPVPVPTLPQALGKKVELPPPQPSPEKTPQPRTSPLPASARPSIESPEKRAAEQAKAANGAPPVLQHPQAVPPPGVPPVAGQPAAAEGSQRHDAAGKAKTPPASQGAAGAASGSLKWEPPYQPHPQTPILPPRPPYVQSNIRPPSSAPQTPGGQPQQPTTRTSPVQNPSPIRPPQSVLVPPQQAGQLSVPVNAGAGVQQQQASQVAAPSNPASAPAAQGQVAPPNAQSTSGTPVPPPVRVPAGSTTPQPSRSTTNIPVPPVQRPHSASNVPSSSNGGAPAGTGPSTTQPGEVTAKPFNTPHSQKSGPADATARSHTISQTPVPVPHHPAQAPSLPQTPLALNVSPHVMRGHATKWTSTPTAATPRLEVSNYFESQSPAYEPISPPLKPAQLPGPSASQPTKKDVRKVSQKSETTSAKTRARPQRGSQKPTTQAEEATGEQAAPEQKIKAEVATPRGFEDTGDTTADESVQDRAVSVGPGRGINKRKRQESPASRPPPASASHVLWTRNFHRISHSALDQVGAHRDGNMFAQPVKDREAPNYRSIVLHPQDLKTIRTAIHNGNKAANAAAANLPDPDPNATSLLLPISVDLVPPRGIINISQLERELVHMFANAIMYAPDPERGIQSPSFLRGASSEEGMEDVIGYSVDENGIVNATRNMFVEVEKLLSDLRNEVERNAPQPVGLNSRSMSLAGGELSTAEDETDEHTGDVDAPNIAKRRRVTRG